MWKQFVPKKEDRTPSSIIRYSLSLKLNRKLSIIVRSIFATTINRCWSHLSDIHVRGCYKEGNVVSTRVNDGLLGVDHAGRAQDSLIKAGIVHLKSVVWTSRTSQTLQTLYTLNMLDYAAIIWYRPKADGTTAYST